MKTVVIMAAAASAASALIAFAPVRHAPPEPLAATAPSSSRPNVLLLVVEGFGSGERRVRTPNLDRLAQRGRRFDAAYTPYPLAGAARTSLMTGWRPERTGVWGEPDGRVEGATPLQEHFHAHGYLTARVGAVYHGPGEAAMRWDAVEPVPPGTSAGGRAAEVVARTRVPFFLAVALDGSTGPATTGAAGVAGGATAPLPAIALGPLDPLARPGRTARPRAASDADRQALAAAEE